MIHYNSNELSAKQRINFYQEVLFLGQSLGLQHKIQPQCRQRCSL